MESNYDNDDVAADVQATESRNATAVGPDAIADTPAGRRGQGRAVLRCAQGVRRTMDPQDDLQDRVDDLARLGVYLIEAVLLCSANLADIAEEMKDARLERRKI